MGRKEVKLVKHNPDWKLFFYRESEKLKKELGEYLINIQHFGSTAVPGISAKPIIDMIAGVSDLEKKKFLKPLQKLGYKHRPNASTAHRLFFRKGDAVKSSYHLHLVKINSQEWKKNLFFRNYLRKNKRFAQKYNNLKKELAKKFANDRKFYLSGKTEFINKIIKSGK